MFAPLLLVDEPYQWMRDVATSTYNVKNNLEIHTCEGDKITGLVSTYGIGTVYRYTQAVSPINPNPAMDLHNEGIATWLENILTYPAGTTW